MQVLVESSAGLRKHEAGRDLILPNRFGTDMSFRMLPLVPRNRRNTSVHDHAHVSKQVLMYPS